MQNKIVETIAGALVLVVAVGFGAYAFNRADVGQSSGYEVQARFTGSMVWPLAMTCGLRGCGLGRWSRKSLIAAVLKRWCG